MPSIEAQIEIAAALSTVFRFCHDVSKRAAWDERVMGAELLSPAPIRAGTLLRIDAAREGEFAFPWDAEYTAFQFPQSSTLQVLDVASSSPFVSGADTWRFSATGGGTRLTVVWEYQPRGFIGRLLDGLGRRAAVRRAIQRSLVNLKTLLEAGG
jgi:hypothetical protein